MGSRCFLLVSSMDVTETSRITDGRSMFSDWSEAQYSTGTMACCSSSLQRSGSRHSPEIVHFAEEPCLISVKQATKPSDNIPSPILHEKASVSPRPNHDRDGRDPCNTFNVPLTTHPEAGGRTT